MSMRGAEDVAVVMLSYSVTEEAGGPGVAAVGFASGLASLGFEVSMLTFESVGQRWLIDAAGASQRGFRFERVDAHSWPGRVWRLAHRAIQIASQTSRREVVLWANGIWREQSLAAAIAARQLGTGYMVRPAGSLGHAALRYRSAKKATYYRMVEKHILGNASAIHCMSTRELLELPQSLRALAFVVPSGVDPVPPNDANMAQDQSPPILGVLARIHPIKRQMEVLGVIEEMLERGTDIKLELAGSVTDAGYETQLRRRVASSPTLRDRVTFLGHVSHSDRQAVVGRWAAALLLSEQENFGHAVISAAALGVPTVATPDVGLAVEMEEARAGLVAQPERAADAVLELLGSRRADYRRSARQFAERFTWRHCSEQLAERILAIARCSTAQVAHT